MKQKNEQAKEKAERLVDEYQRFFVPATGAVSFDSFAQFEIYSAYPDKDFVISNQATPRRTRRA